MQNTDILSPFANPTSPIRSPEKQRGGKGEKGKVIGKKKKITYLGKAGFG